MLAESQYRVYNKADAFHARLDSDYAPYPNPDPDAVQQLVERAQAFVERISRYLKEVEASEETDHASE